MRARAAKKDLMKELNSAAVEINGYLQSKRRFLLDADSAGANLTGRERQRLFGAGIKNYGFIEKAYDIAEENPGFMPPHFDTESLRESLRDFENMRQLVFELEQFLQAAANVTLQASDANYRNALRVYGSLREQTRNRVPGAEPLFEALRTFFHRRKRAVDGPTEKELKRDFEKLLHGKADGEIVVKNESPRASGGVRKVVDGAGAKDI
jgi:hypothetical protein